MKRWFANKSSQPPTLQLRRPFGQLIPLTFLLFLIVLSATEALLQSRTVRLALGTPSLGTAHLQFEQQWFRLTEYAADQEAIDCIFIGDSTVMSDFSPIPFTQTYQEQTGDSLECFNFGTGAFTVEGLATLAQILIQEHEPRLLIVGLEALNFTVPHAEQGGANLTDTAWARYKTGEFSLEGWLYEQIYFYRFRRAMGRLVTFTVNPKEVMLSDAGTIGDAQAGFFPMEGTSVFDVSKPPDPNFDHPYIEHYYAELGDFHLLDENLAALNRILDLNDDTTEIILVEMPVTETSHEFFGNDEQDYKLFVNTIQKRAEAQNIPFCRMPNLQNIPASFWFNYNHLNEKGAPLFSRWLGRELSKVTKGI